MTDSTLCVQVEILDNCYLPWIIMTLLPYFSLGQGALTTHVARALPFSNIALSGSPSVSINGVSKIRCIVECTKNNCSSFNFGTTTCELFHMYLCEDTESLVSRTGFKHYDVEFGLWAQDVDTYRETPSCTALGKCSPKCYASGGSTTTTLAPTTTTAPPAPGEVNHECTTENDCLTPDSNCRNGIKCECTAGHSYNPSNKSCDHGCDTYGSSYSLTTDKELQNNTLWSNETLPNREACELECQRTQLCIGYLWNFVVEDCYVLGAFNDTTFHYNPFFEYWQRNCDS